MTRWEVADHVEGRASQTGVMNREDMALSAVPLDLLQIECTRAPEPRSMGSVDSPALGELEPCFPPASRADDR
ncbi:MAG: hypothetical protein AAF085_15090 [Planctomycetota bacterium]